MSVNSKMTAIANATRALDGSTAALTLDGIASKLGVEKTNIAAALAALAEKGVTVPDGSTSAALAALIASIEAGGGVQVNTGTFTVTEATTVSGFIVEHNSGFIPRIFLCHAEKSTHSDIENLMVACGIYLRKHPQYGAEDVGLTWGVGYTSTSSSTSTGFFELPSGTSAFLQAVTAQNAPLIISKYGSQISPNRTYHWIAVSDWEGIF